MEISYSFTTYPKSILQNPKKIKFPKKNVSFNNIVYLSCDQKYWHEKLPESYKQNSLQH